MFNPVSKESFYLKYKRNESHFGVTSFEAVCNAYVWPGLLSPHVAMMDLLEVALIPALYCLW